MELQLIFLIAALANLLVKIAKKKKKITFLYFNYSLLQSTFINLAF
jgi:hypothetical protein